MTKIKSDYCIQQGKKPRNRTQHQVGREYGFLSGLEETISNTLKEKGINFKYEEKALKFTQPEKQRKYTPDFFMYDSNGDLAYIVESKGRFTKEDRDKMLWVKEQYPEYEFRLLFSYSNAKISKGAKTTYGQWAEKNGFKYAQKTIPEAWILELKKGGANNES